MDILKKSGDFFSSLMTPESSAEKSGESFGDQFILSLERNTSERVPGKADLSAVLALSFPDEKAYPGVFVQVCELLKKKSLTKLIITSAQFSREKQLILVCSTDLFFAKTFQENAREELEKIGSTSPFGTSASSHENDEYSSSRKCELIMKTLLEITAESEDTSRIPNVTFVEKESIITKLLQTGNIVSIFPLRHAPEIQKIQSSFSQWDHDLCISNMCNYFGEEIATYFKWLDHFNKTLLVPTGLGVLSFLLSFVLELGAYFALFLSVVTTLWAIASLELWKGTYEEIRADTTKSKPNEAEQRAQFRGEWVHEENSHVPTKKVHPPVQAIRLIIGYGCLAFLFYQVSWLSTVLVDFQYRNKDSFFWSILAFTLQTIFSYLGSYIYGLISPFVLDFENHEFESEFNKHAVTKRIIFEIGNRFWIFMYTAFVLQDLGVLAFQLHAYFIIGQLLNAAVENSLPYIRMKWRERFGGEDQNVSQSQETISQSTLEAVDGITEEVKNNVILDDYAGTFDEYIEIVLQFMFVTCFTPIMPLAALYSQVNNFFEWESDMNKLLQHYKRPMPAAANMDHWIITMDIISVFSIAVNAGLCYISAKQVYSSDALFSVLVVVLLVEHILFGLKALVLVYASNIKGLLGIDFAQGKKKTTSSVSNKQSRPSGLSVPTPFIRADSGDVIPPTPKEERQAINGGKESQHSSGKKKKEYPKSLAPFQVPDIAILAASVLGYICGLIQLHVFAMPFIYYVFRAWELWEEGLMVKSLAESSAPTINQTNQVFDTCENSEWLNHIFAVVFNKYHSSIDDYLKNYIDSWLDFYKPAFLTTLKVSKVDVGDAAPRLFNWQGLSRRKFDNMYMECDVKFKTNAKIYIVVGIKKKEFEIKIDDIQVSLKQLRMAFKLTSGGIGVSAITLQTEHVPSIDFGLVLPYIGDLMDVQFIRSFLDKTIKTALRGFLVDQAFKISLFEEADEVAYDLEVSLNEGKVLPIADMNGKSDPYCILDIGQQSHRSSVKDATLNPSWKEKFRFPVAYKKGYGIQDDLIIKVYDKDITVDDFLGKITVPLKDLKPLLYVLRIFDLEDANTGTVSIGLYLKPSKPTEETEGTINIKITGLSNPENINKPFKFVSTLRYNSAQTPLLKASDVASKNAELVLPTTDLNEGILTIQLFEENQTIIGTTRIDLSSVFINRETKLFSPLTGNVEGSLLVTIRKVPWSLQKAIIPELRKVEVAVLEVRDFVLPTLSESNTILTKSVGHLQRTASFFKKATKFTCHIRVSQTIQAMDVSDKVKSMPTFDAHDISTQSISVYLCEQNEKLEDNFGLVKIPLSSLNAGEQTEKWFNLESTKYKFEPNAPKLRITTKLH